MSSNTADAKLIPFPRTPALRRTAAELQFLPAALEIIETPASPAGRTTMTAMCALVTFAVGWACFGKIDIIATATGRIIPSGQVKVIQPFDIGVVKAIHVSDGDHVHAGDVLIELDPTTNAADQERVNRDLVQAELDAARLTAILGGDAASFVAPPSADASLIEAARRELSESLSQHRAKIEGLDRQIAAKTAERDQAKATTVKVAASLPLAQQRADIYRELKATLYTSKVAALEAEQALVEAQHNGAVAQHQLEQAQAEIAALEQQRLEADAEFRTQTMDDLAKTRQKVAEERTEQVKAVEKTGLQTLHAPVDGTVEQLSTHTVGGVVTPAQSLMVIVPEGSRLEIEAMLPNRDVGFVHAGQPAEVKVEAFTYTRYGLLHGKVEGVSRDAIAASGSTSKPSDRGNIATSIKDADGAEGAAGASPYIARVFLVRTEIDTEQGPQSLEPGMTVTAEIKTGRRRLIEYLVSPLLRYRHEGLRER